MRPVVEGYIHRTDFLQSGGPLAFDRDGFGVNEKRVESFVSTLVTGLSSGWGRGVKLCFPI